MAILWFIIKNAKKYEYIKELKGHLECENKGKKLIEALEKLKIDLNKEKTVEFGKQLKKVYKEEIGINEIIDKVKDLSTNYFCKDIGLCIYLFEYAERTNDENIKSLAEDFIERICWNLPKEISILTLTDKQEISIAIDYMIEKKYIEGDINDILYDIDITIYK
mgnify:CR=1 FL=1